MVPEKEGYVAYRRCHCRSAMPRWDVSRGSQPAPQRAAFAETIGLCDCRTGHRLELITAAEDVEDSLWRGGAPVTCQAVRKDAVA